VLFGESEDFFAPRPAYSRGLSALTGSRAALLAPVRKLTMAGMFQASSLPGMARIGGGSLKASVLVSHASVGLGRLLQAFSTSRFAARRRKPDRVLAVLVGAASILSNSFCGTVMFTRTILAARR
jgi:hypothetical protein